MTLHTNAALVPKLLSHCIDALLLPSRGVYPIPPATQDAVVAGAEVRALQKRIRELERLLGRKTLENEILREAIKVAQEKN